MTDRISWDNYFMSIAYIASLRSIDPHTKVGAVLVDSEHHIVGTGYNSFVKGIDDTQLPLSREGDFLSTKYPFIVHAEINCILNSITPSITNSILYCTLFPCNECMKAIINKGIKEVVYLNEPVIKDIYIASKRLMELAQIKCRKLPYFSLKDILKE
jgi:dCMP deaminase